MKPIIVIQLGLVLCLSVGGLIGQEGKVSVEKVTENVYLYTYESHRSLFVVTDDGILVTDPQSAERAGPYLQEIRKISQAPIRYMVYSHHHGDHVSGGAVFGSDPIIIAHSKIADHLGSSGSKDIAPPHVTFSDKLSVFLGDLEIRLIFPGPNEADDNIIVFVPDRKVVFMADTVGVRRLPWRVMSGANPYDWMAGLRVLATLDFEILAPGHGRTGTKAHVEEYIRYFVDLIEAVEERAKQGQTLEEIQESLKMPAYANWLFYDEFLKMNIEGVHRYLSKAP
jgi:glyoxylase-like metal-dependent hydrolase (beta-lactamase superfamily II)